MTKSQERGENDVSREAKIEAARTGETVCEVLARMLTDAKRAGDGG